MIRDRTLGAWRDHKRPVLLMAVVVLLDTGFGVWYAAVQGIPVTSGMAYTLGVVSTSGSSVPAGTSGSARLITALSQLLLIPLGAAVISLVTAKIAAGMTAVHVVRQVSEKLDDHHSTLHKRLDDTFGSWSA